MVKSMTGFGRAELNENSKKITIEVKSVNHRYLDLNIKMPKKLGMFDAALRNILKEYAQRGKVDIFVTYEDETEASASLKYNKALAQEYVDYFKAIHEDFGIENDIRVSTIARSPEVLVLEEQQTDEEELAALVEKCARSAFSSFVSAREKEGDHLLNDLVAKLDEMLGLVDFIEERSPIIITEYKTKMMERVAEFLQDSKIDESRIAMEVTLFADKVCVDEEIVRLRSHINHMKNVLIEGGAVGRKLDFISQEMNREANTILSKTSDIEISNTGIELKTSIEKVREQIQNLE